MHHLPSSAQAAPSQMSSSGGECHKASGSALPESFYHPGSIPAHFLRKRPPATPGLEQRPVCVPAAHTSLPLMQCVGAVMAQPESARSAALQKPHQLPAVLPAIPCLMSMCSSLAKVQHFVYPGKEDSLICFSCSGLFVCHLPCVGNSGFPTFISFWPGSGGGLFSSSIYR